LTSARFDQRCLIMHKLNIAIVGYGVAGIAAAIHLRRTGHDIHHFEKRARVQSLGAGVVLQPPTLRLLHELGAYQEIIKQGAVIKTITAHTINGRQLMALNYPVNSFGLGIRRQVLLDTLSNMNKGYAELSNECEITAVDAQAGYLSSQQHRYGPYDLIIAADGSNSTLRQCIPRLIKRNHEYPWSAIVCCINDPAGLAGDHLKQFFSPKRHVSIWPVGSHREPSINIAMNVERKRRQEYLSIDRWESIIEQHCPFISPLLRASEIESRLMVYNYRDVVIRQAVYGRLVFIGDAAHSMSPQLGQGVKLGLQDAALLANVIQRNQNLFQALDEFEQQQKNSVGPYQRLSRYITPVFQSQTSLMQSIRELVFFSMKNSHWFKSRVLKTLIAD